MRKRYKTKFLTKVFEHEYWGVWDEKKKDFVRDNFNLRMDFIIKKFADNFAKILNSYEEKENKSKRY